MTNRTRKQIRIINGVECVSAKKLAEDPEIGLNDQYIRMLANDNKIPGHIVGNQWYFDPKAVKAARGVVESETAKNSSTDISDEVLLSDPLFGL